MTSSWDTPRTLIGRKDLEMSEIWMRKNPSLAVEAILKFWTEDPTMIFTTDVRRPGFVTLVAQARS